MMVFSPTATLCVCLYLKELKGKFLIKGKRLNKLEASFAQEAAAAEDTDVTEEEESDDEDEDQQKVKVGAVSLIIKSVKEELWYIST